MLMMTDTVVTVTKYLREHLKKKGFILFTVSEGLVYDCLAPYRTSQWHVCVEELLLHFMAQRKQKERKEGTKTRHNLQSHAPGPTSSSAASAPKVSTAS
jgi:hypothetical protein